MVGHLIECLSGVLAYLAHALESPNRTVKESDSSQAPRELAVLLPAWQTGAASGTRFEVGLGHPAVLGWGLRVATLVQRFY